MTEGKRAIIQQQLQEYDVETAEDIQNALKDLLGGTIKEMMEAEMEDHLGYEKSERIERTKETDYRNGTNPKQVNTGCGAMTINVPQDRKAFASDLKKTMGQMLITKQKSAMMLPKNGLKNTLQP